MPPASPARLLDPRGARCKTGTVLPLPAGAPVPWHGPAHLPGSHTRGGNAMGRTRLGLLTGAARAFAEHGLRRSTMQSVAAAAGVAKATLYNHFRTKDDVATALLGLELDRLSTLAAGLPLEPALATLSDELGAHPVLRRLAETEPDALAALLAVDADRWADTDRAAGRRAAPRRRRCRDRRALAAGRRPPARTLDHAAPARARLAAVLTATGAAAPA